MEYRSIETIGDLTGKTVILRLDLNVPIQNNRVVDDYRIKKSLWTLNYLCERRAKILIISHIEDSSDTLRPVYEHMKDELSLPITFCEDCLENGREMLQKIAPGEIVLSENIRLYDGEKKNDQAFAQKLASLGDMYVNEAFPVSHRKHASVVGVPQYVPGYVGMQFQEEIRNLSLCFNPPKPFLFILGGAKFDTKLPLVTRFLDIADWVFVGGALANDLFKAKGYTVGQSKVSETNLDLGEYARHPKILLPVDVVLEDKSVTYPDQIGESGRVLDAGPKTIEMLRQKIGEAKLVLWNGPLGNYENGFKNPTLDLARLISQATDHAATVIGGGDTLAAISELGLQSKFTFLSTGGGAMLDFLAQGTLPGLEALKDSK